MTFEQLIYSLLTSPEEVVYEVIAEIDCNEIKDEAKVLGVTEDYYIMEFLI